MLAAVRQVKNEYKDITAKPQPPTKISNHIINLIDKLHTESDAEKKR